MTVRVDTETSLYEVTAGLLKGFYVDPLFYRDREVLTLDAGDVTRISVRRQRGEESAVREAGGPFAPFGPEAGDLHQAAVQKMLEVVGRLRVVEYVADNPEDLSVYGLEPPGLEVTFGLTGQGAISKTVLLGDALEKGGVYAMIRGEDVVFVLDEDAGHALREPLYLARSGLDENSVVKQSNNSEEE